MVYLHPLELSELFTDEELALLPRSKRIAPGPRKGATGSSTRLVTSMGPSKRQYVYAPETSRDPQFLDEERIASELLPTHPGLALVSVGLQILSAGVGRLVVCMEKL